MGVFIADCHRRCFYLESSVESFGAESSGARLHAVMKTCYFLYDALTPFQARSQGLPPHGCSFEPSRALHNEESCSVREEDIDDLGRLPSSSVPQTIETRAGDSHYR